MSYIGATPVIGNFQKCDAITTSATDTFNLLVGGAAVSPATANNCIVSLNGVVQAPTTAFTIVGSTIVFDSALTTSDVIDFIVILGNTLDVGVPSDDTVTAAKLNDTAISGQTALGAEPADTDEFLVSDAGALKRVDYSYIKAPSASGWQFVETVVGSNDATVQFSTAMTTGFDYQVQVTYVQPTVETNTFRAQLGTDASTFLTSNYVGTTIGWTTSATTGSSMSTYIYLNPTGAGDATNEFTSVVMTLFDPAVAQKTQIMGHSNAPNTSGVDYPGQFYCIQTDASAITHIKFYWQAGNTDVGDFRLYKRANA